MDIRINRFNVSYQGKIYGPGSVIYNVSKKIGEKLVEESNGEIEKLPLRGEIEELPPQDEVEIVPSQEETKKTQLEKETKKTQSQKVKESESTPGGEGGDPILSPVDPSKTVK